MKKEVAAANPDAYVAALDGWRRDFVEALRAAVLEAAPDLDERIKWRHLVYFSNGPVLLIRAEQERVLFGFWRGKRLLHLEPRMTGGGKYELRTLELRQGTPLDRATVLELVRNAVALNHRIGNPTTITP
ncbi:DUF1801 domain-containing protein [Pseudoduganella sp. DS3]|uniref:DUF1801 domain-containing protein n=1 Tax=Pseudoduganella guangdongensis TaxID=2692179 RepID=A0A6N9HDD8_9BURK|nr:DUF1801 domain-containing protein [Pseudoduganella guangdongensis]MYN01456.1 DUF1801 domain-containing protein [Pseudoduganella guangdongensis]